jgi:hypothetical protein
VNCGNDIHTTSHIEEYQPCPLLFVQPIEADGKIALQPMLQRHSWTGNDPSRQPPRFLLLTFQVCMGDESCPLTPYPFIAWLVSRTPRFGGCATHVRATHIYIAQSKGDVCMIYVDTVSENDDNSAITHRSHGTPYEPNCGGFYP